jgi:Leucine-rich repeat (LRR) protein
MRFPAAFFLGLCLVVGARSQPAPPEPTADEKQLMELVVKAGGRAEIHPQLPPPGRVAVKFDSATDLMLFNLKNKKAPLVGSLEILDMSRCTDKGFALLKEFPNLRRLSIAKSNLTAARVAAIGQCKELRVLYLANANLTDSELPGLKNLTRLESLDLSNNPKITDKGLTVIKSLERLQALYLRNTGITNAGLPELKPLDGLRTLHVGNTAVTPEAAERFADEMPNLRAVRH